MLITRNFSCLFVLALLVGGLVYAYEEQPPRFANGIVIEGTIEKISEDGLVMQSEKGRAIHPWKYLSAATLYRYQRHDEKLQPDDR